MELNIWTFSQMVGIWTLYSWSRSKYYVYNFVDIGSPEGLSIDWISRNIYWTDSSKDTLEVANLDNKLRKILFSDNLVNPRGIAVHPQRGLVLYIHLFKINNDGK